MPRKLVIVIALIGVASFTAWAIHDTEQTSAAAAGVAVPDPPPPPVLDTGPNRYWLVDNQPLDRPIGLVALRLPSTVVLADGGAVEIEGIRLVAPLDASALAGLVNVDGAHVDVEILRPGSPVSKIDVKHGGVGICGNSRGPVPKYFRHDLATVLVMRGVALPTVSFLRDHPDRASELLHALQTGIGTYNVREPVALAGDAEAAGLGRRLYADHPKLKFAGAWLMGMSRDPEAAPAIASLAKELLTQGIAGNDHETARRVLTVRLLLDLLYELGEREAFAALTREEFDASGTALPAEQPMLACSLVALGDWTLLDELARRLTDPTLSDIYADQLANHLADRLDFPLADGGDRHALARWYAAVRPRLTWDRVWHFGFGPDTRDQYQASMQTYLGGAQAPPDKP